MGKNKIVILIVLVCLLFQVNGVVFAQSVSCEYDKVGLVVTFSDSGKSTINQDFFPKQDTPWYINWLINNNSGRISATENLKTQEPELFGLCPEKVYVCKYEEYSANSGLKNFFFSDTGRFLHLKKVYLYYSEGDMNRSSAELSAVDNDWKWDVTSEYITRAISAWNTCAADWNFGPVDEIVGSICVVGSVAITGFKGVWNAEELAIKRKKCENSQYTGNLPTYSLACPNLTVYLKRFLESKNEYDSCKGDAACEANATTKMNSVELNLKNYCNAILQEQDYDGGIEQDCITSCLSIGETIAKLKGMSLTPGKCGFSDRLLVWARNILRWIKYILPVAVIVLGILDFIKAIGADKDDEMKKAQKRFIIRLIAAALVFIIPLIIEFILGKMGFGYNDCGLF